MSALPHEWTVGTIAEVDWRNDDGTHGGTCLAWKDVKGWSALDEGTGFLLPSDVTAVRPKRLVDADALVLPGVNQRGEQWRADWLMTAAGVLREANHWQGTMLCESAAETLGRAPGGHWCAVADGIAARLAAVEDELVRYKQFGEKVAALLRDSPAPAGAS